MHLPLEADFRELAESVNHIPGWYLLQVVDKLGDLLPGAPTACVEVVPENQEIDSPDLATDPSAFAVQRLTETLHQSLMASSQREQAMVSTMAEMTATVYSGLAQVQQSTAALISAVQAGLDIASGVSLQKLPPTPEPADPETPPQKSFLEFLCSPAGNTAINALGGVLKAAVGDK